MIEKLFNHPHLLHQTPDSETDVANEAIAGQIDNGGTIVLSQEGRHIASIARASRSCASSSKNWRRWRWSDQAAQKEARPRLGAEKRKVSKAILQSVREIQSRFNRGYGLGIEPVGSVKQPDRLALVAQDLNQLFVAGIGVPDDHAVKKGRVFPRIATTPRYEGIVMLKRHFYRYLHSETLVLLSTMRNKRETKTI